MHYKSVLVLGRQPAIGRAELESLYGGERLEPLGEFGMACSLPAADIAFERLGGSVKLGEVLGIIESNDWRRVQAGLTELAVHRAQDLSEGKIQLGISSYGLRVNTKQLTAAGLELKKALRGTGYSVRLVPNQEPALSSAQVLHNHLAGERGLELLLLSDGKQTVVARTTRVQDITAYARRDQNRPKRDARVGMLPPKLAQTIINLSGAQPGETVWDPFCGTGVLLQEALLMEMDVYGSDIEPRMIDYASTNLAWLETHYASPRVDKDAPNNWSHLEVADATTVTFASQHAEPVQHLACETYLGQPYTTLPAAEKLATNIRTCNLIVEKFLQNAARQFAPGTRHCIAVPAWRNASGAFTHLPLLDHLGELGYNRVNFRYAQDKDLVYSREDQIVARELLVIIRK